jgi:hypothetical protein
MSRLWICAALGVSVSATWWAGCSREPMPIPPELKVLVSTAGPDPDLSAYIVTVGTHREHIDRDGSFTFTQISPGTYTVQLDDIAANCAVSGGPTRQVTVVEAQTTEVSFDLSCHALPPALVDVSGMWKGTLDSTDWHLLTYDLEQDGDSVRAALIKYENTITGEHHENVGVGRVSDSTFTLYFEGPAASGCYARVTATLMVRGNEMTGEDRSQLDCWSAALALTRQ